ncbi:V-snare-domain-containing protein [Gautieria morchelliformis]|nr:V-snare-domain-containing protein [Gautieria morchelliformis]
MDYDSLRRQARTLEFLLDSKLTAYSRIVTTITKDGNDVESAGAAERWQDLEAEVEDLLEKLNEINEGMSTLLSDKDSPPSQAIQHTVQRHRDVLRDYNRDFSWTKTNVRTAMDRANLLTNVRNDIDAYHRSSAADSLLAERGRIDSSHRMTDDLLGQAYATRDEFSRQRSSLASINARMGGVLSTFPGIDSLLSMIKTRRRRDTVIVGCIIGLGIVFLLSYMSR